MAGKDAEHIQQSIHHFNQHPALQSKCKELEKNGHRYLKIASEHGRSIAAKRPIPSGTELCYYIGIIYDGNPEGNYCVDGGLVGETQLNINASDIPDNLPLGCCMHLVNHGCNPNGKVETYVPEGWDNDLELLILTATCKIDTEEHITFRYEGTMWQSFASLPLTIPPGFRAIKCGCHDPCPNGLGRLDRITRRSRVSSATQAQWSRGRFLESAQSASGDGPEIPPQSVLTNATQRTPPRPTVPRLKQETLSYTMPQTPLGVSNGVNRTVMQHVDPPLRMNIDSGSLAIREASLAPKFAETVAASDLERELTSLEEDESEQLIVHPRVATYLGILRPVAEQARATTPATELKISFYLRVCKKAPCS